MKFADKCFGGFGGLPQGFEVLAFDNNSTDNTVEHIKNKYPFVKIIESKENLGFGKANNAGLRMALDNGFDYAFLLNQDAWISGEDIRKLAEVQSKNEDYYIVSPLHYNGSGTDFDIGFKGYIDKSGSPVLLDFAKNEYKELYETKGINAAAWLISRKCLNEIGGFSPSFFHYSEDDNYTDRVRYHKKKIGVSPLALMYHDRENNFHVGEHHVKKVHLIRKRIYDISRPEKKTNISEILKYLITSIRVGGGLAQMLKLRDIIRNKNKSRTIGQTFL
jgi:GT2 family glycosyltransferase